MGGNIFSTVTVVHPFHLIKSGHNFNYNRLPTSCSSTFKMIHFTEEHSKSCLYIVQSGEKCVKVACKVSISSNNLGKKH